MTDENTTPTSQTNILMKRMDEFEHLMRSFITQEVKTEIRRLEPEITIRITEAVTGKVNAMLEAAAEKRLASYEDALRKAQTEMTLSFTSALSQFELRMAPKMEAISRVEGASSMLTQVIDGFRRDAQDARRVAEEVRTVATDTETRIREAYHAQDKKIDDIRESVEDTLAPIRYVFSVLRKPKNLALLATAAGGGAGVLKFIEVLTNFVSSGAN